MSALTRKLGSFIQTASLLLPKYDVAAQVRCKSYNRKSYNSLKTPKPVPGIPGTHFWRIVHYEDEEKYTVKPLRVTNLAGRDPISGRKVVQGVGGGIKHKYHWVEWKRAGPTEADVPPIEEVVIQILTTAHRSAHLALVARGDEMKYYIASENMKAGDIIKTSSFIPRVPVKANEGDAYPLGALPDGSLVHCVERTPGAGGTLMHAAGTCATILKKHGGKVTLKMPSKHEFVLDQYCMAVVGRVSNVLHGETHIGSPQRLRELGYRPRSGLWQRKTGRFGRKIRAPKKIVISPAKPQCPRICLDDY